MPEFMENMEKTDSVQQFRADMKNKLDSFEGNILELIARKRGMMISGGEPDTERAAITLLDEYRSGKIGKITLEMPPASGEI